MLYKRKISNEAINDFKYLLQHVNWNNILNSDTNNLYENFLKKFGEIYDIVFPGMNIEIK